MSKYGVTFDGFNIKTLDVILSEGRDRAQQMFGDSVDLTPTSPLYKILQVASAEDAELWKRMEDLYFGNFVSTAGGDNLSLLGEDIGVTRRHLFSEGNVTFTINNPQPERDYLIPEGTVVETGAASPVTFYTTEPVILTDAITSSDVSVCAFERGPSGNIAANDIVRINPIYAQFYLSLGGTTTVDVTNATAFTGGLDMESDEVYRNRLLGYPRNMWTVESARRAIMDVDGVVDAELFDPLGGVDVSQSYFNLFNYRERSYSSERRLGEPYFFDVVVAHEYVWPWHDNGTVKGVYERVHAALDLVRPIGIHPNILQADHIDVGVRAKVIIEAGHDQAALLASIKEQIASDIAKLKLGGDVLYSELMCAFKQQAAVLDVQNLHLRRCPPTFGRISFGDVPHQNMVVEAAAGENLVMGPREIPVFRLDSNLITIEVISR